jgi:hypothetical protein
MENEMNSLSHTDSPERELIVEYASKAFGGSPQVDYYGDKNEELKVGILSSRDRPMNGITSYSTIGLSDHAMPRGDGEFPTRLELAGVCVNEEEKFANVLASAAFCIIRSHLVYHPGTVMKDYVRLVFPDFPLPHLYLTTQFLWGNSLRTLDVVTRKVSWLLAIPIAESEWVYLETMGKDAFESALEEAQIDVSDLSREPVA